MDDVRDYQQTRKAHVDRMPNPWEEELLDDPERNGKVLFEVGTGKMRKPSKWKEN